MALGERASLAPIPSGSTQALLAGDGCSHASLVGGRVSPWHGGVFPLSFPVIYGAASLPWCSVHLFCSESQATETLVEVGSSCPENKCRDKDFVSTNQFI